MPIPKFCNGFLPNGVIHVSHNTLLVVVCFFDAFFEGDAPTSRLLSIGGGDLEDGALMDVVEGVDGLATHGVLPLVLPVSVAHAADEDQDDDDE